MRRSIQFLMILALAFTSGHLAYAKYQAQQPPAQPALEELRQAAKRIIKRGHASWYSKRDPGVRRHTANMEIFDDRQMTCAMWDVPFNQMIKVTNLQNGKSVIVRVNDRGPHKRYVRKGRVIDLTKSAFQKIAPLKKGLIEIELELL